jgi:hypothetical protein
MVGTFCPNKPHTFILTPDSEVRGFWKFQTEK